MLRCFEIDDELELLRLLHREIGGLGAFQNLVDIRSGASVQVADVHAVKHKPAGFYKLAVGVYRGETVLHCELGNLNSLRNEDGAC